jgi:hypothetical protein
MGDHLIAATLYDGIVVQPRMVATPMQGEVEKPVEVPASTAPAAVPTASVAAPPAGEVLGPNGVPVVEPVHLPTSPN